MQNTSDNQKALQAIRKDELVMQLKLDKENYEAAADAYHEALEALQSTIKQFMSMEAQS